MNALKLSIQCVFIKTLGYGPLVVLALSCIIQVPGASAEESPNNEVSRTSQDFETSAKDKSDQKESGASESPDANLKLTGAYLYNDLKLLASEEVVYSASKRLEALRTNPMPITVINREHLEAIDPQFIPQVLRLYPGLDVIQISRTEFTVSIRGFSNRSNFIPRDLLVLVDGRTVYDDFSGGVDWDTLDVYPRDIGKIEVIRGADSAIHGANASRGVINIITKPPDAVPTFETDTSLSDGGFRERLAGSYLSGRYKWKITGGYDDINVWNRFPDVTLSDDNGLHTWRFNSVVAKELPNNAELRLNVGSNTGQMLVHNSSAVLEDRHQSTDHVQLEYESPFLSVRTFWNYKHVESFDPVFGQFDVERHQNLYDFEVVKRVINAGENAFTVGVNVRYTTVNAGSTNGRVGESTGGIFADDQYNINPNLVVRLAGRIDYHELAGYHFSPEAGIAYQFYPKQILKVSTAVGYRNPTISDNFLDLRIDQGPSPFFIKGNRDLDPERSVWYQVGYVGEFIHRLTMGIDLYSVSTDNLIRSQFVPPDTSSLINASTKVRGEGGELWGQYEVSSSVRLLANYANEQFREASTHLTTSPRNKINVGLLFIDVSKFSGALTYHFVDRTAWPFFVPGAPNQSAKLPSYYTINTSIGYSFTENLIARLNAYNLSNNKHTELPEVGEELSREIILILTYKM